MTTTRRIRFPSRLLIPLFLIVALTTGCQTTVGNYFGNRGRDLGECFRVQTGLGLGLGAGVLAGGLVNTGLCIGQTSGETGMGWVYGEGYAFGRGASNGSAGNETEFYYILYHSFSKGESSFRRKGLDSRFHECYLPLPGLFTRIGDKWIWANEGPRIRRARIHAFDFEASVYAGIVYAKAGFSPGEFVDFLLGWFGVDIAGDDRTLGPEEKIGEGVDEEQLR